MRRRSGRWPTLLATAGIALLHVAPASAQQGVVGGTVVQEGSLRPISGAQVAVQGTELGTLTNARGRFLIMGLAQDRVTLRVVMLGYRTVTREVAVGTTDLQIVLEETAVELEGLVVTGVPGETQARTIGNAVSQVRFADRMETNPVGDLQSLLKGAAPGVAIRTGQGNVGTGGVVHIRGLTSLSLENQPLIYIDGVRVNNDMDTGPSIRGGSQVSRMNDLAPEEIESIEIIKGPAAATLYGTEASNGVIQIITKRGAPGEPTIDLTVKQGANYFRNAEGRLPTNYTVSGGQLISLDLYEAELAAGRKPLQTGHVQAYSLTVRGGTESVRYFGAASWDKSEGVVDYNWQDKLNLRGNLQLIPTDELKVSLNLGLVDSETRFGQAASGWDLMGQFVWGNPATRDTRLRGFLRATPEAAAEIESFSEVTRVVTGVNVNYTPTDWLTSRLNVGLDITNEENSILFPRHPTGSEYFFGAGSLGDKSAERQTARFTTVDFGTTAERDFTDDLSSATSVGFQFFTKETEFLLGRGLQFPAPPIKTIGGAAVTFSSEGFIENKTTGVYVQERLGWKNRLFLTGAIRGDDNSAFGENFDFVTYPKISASWVLNEEPFFDVPWVSALKLRGAWGMAGQQPDVFAALRLYQPATGPGDSSILTPQTIGNPDLEPEKGQEIELGFDAGLFDDRLGVEFTYYNQSRKDAIIQSPVPPSSGFPGVRFLNVGEVRSWGVELGVTADLIHRDALGWNLGVNLSTNDSEVADLGGFPALQAGALQLHREGHPVGAFFMRRVVSAQVDADGTVTQALCAGGEENGGQPVPCADAPQVFAGVPNPKVFGSVNSEVSLFDNLRLSALVDFQLGHKIINGDISGAHHVFRNTRAIHRPQEFPVLAAYDQLPGFSFFHSGLLGAGWVKLRNVSATYNVPDRLVGDFGVSRASVTVAANNLAILWQETEELFGRRVIDPENRLTTAEQSGYVQTVLPHLSSFTTTIRLSF